MRYLLSLIAGSLFGAGLYISDMINPERVLGFLDILGTWDPTLMFVMGGGLVPMAIAWRIKARRDLNQGGKSISGQDFQTPTKVSLDKNLIIGAVFFGAGWGMVGLCPGPALANLLTAGVPVLIFVVAMAAGSVLFGVTAKVWQPN